MTDRLTFTHNQSSVLLDKFFAARHTANRAVVDIATPYPGYDGFHATCETQIPATSLRCLPDPNGTSSNLAGDGGSSGHTIATSPVLLLPRKMVATPFTTTAAIATTVAKAAAAGAPKAASTLPGTKPRPAKTDPLGAGERTTSGRHGSGTITTSTTPDAAASALPLPRPAAPAAPSGRSVEETLAALHRAHIAALQLQEGTRLANEALRVENHALKRESRFDLVMMLLLLLLLLLLPGKSGG